MGNVFIIDIKIKKKQKIFIINFFLVELSSGERTRQQFFRTRPQDKFVSEGGRAIISCVIGNLGGRVQWTKDGLTLGM